MVGKMTFIHFPLLVQRILLHMRGGSCATFHVVCMVCVVIAAKCVLKWIMACWVMDSVGFASDSLATSTSVT